MHYVSSCTTLEKVKATAIRGRRDSNVSRAEGEETDGIEVVEVSDGDDDEGEEEAKENGGDGAEAEPAKISSNLFRRRKEREIADGTTGDDISVDVDFFNQAKPDPAEAAEMNVDEIDGAKSRAREGKISLKLFEKKKRKKGEPTKRSAADEQMADEEDSVDMDFLSSSRKRPLNEEEKAEKKPLSPQLFKPSKRRKRGGAAAAAGKIKSTKLSYDSDSLDVEVLSALAAKSFGGGSGGGSGPSPETSPNAFTALMKKPLAENYCGKSTKPETKAAVEGASDLAQSDVSPTGNKENAKSAVEVPSGTGKRKEVKNNAFARLMTAAKKRGVWEEEEQEEQEQVEAATLPVTTESVDDELHQKVAEPETPGDGSEKKPAENPESGVKGNRNAFARLMRAAKEKDAWKEAEEDTETRATSRPASPIADSPSVGDPEKQTKRREAKKKKNSKGKRARQQSDNEPKDDNSGAEKVPSRPQTPKDEAELGDDEETKQSCGRRSSRIQKNREATEKKRKEREEAEKLLDEQIAEKRKGKKAAKGCQKGQKRVEEEEEEVVLSDDDDEIRVEKIVLSPARKKTRKAASDHLGYNSIALCYK